MEIYDRQGRPMSVDAYAERCRDWDYKRVALDKVGPYEISTVWLGVDHGWGDGPPLIFETMVFAPVDRSLGPDLDMQRYSTEVEARAGHDEMVLIVRATYQEAIPGEPE